MQRTPTTPNVGVKERRYRVGQGRPSETADTEISGKVVGEGTKAAPPGTIGLSGPPDIRRGPRKIKIALCEPREGYDPGRLEMALRMLISEKDIIEYFARKLPPGRPAPHHSPNRKSR